MWLLKRLLIIIVLAGIASLVGLAGELHWLADLANHFRWYYFVVAIVGVVLFSFVQKWSWVGVALLVVGLNYSVTFLYSGLLSNPIATNNVSATITFAQVNVNLNNTNTAPLLEWLQRKQPDVVAVEEYTPTWANAFKQLQAIYSYKVEHPRNDGFGIALFSRQPIENLKIEYFGPDQVPSVTGLLPWKQQKIQLLATHPFPPMSQAKAISRDSQLAEVADWLKYQQKPVVLLGDLNTTPWGHSFRNLTNKADLYSPRDGAGLLASWPGKIPLIPIDHILLSKSLKTISIKVGPDIGSDHLPLIVTVGLE